jgi:dCMP deaminase
MKKLVLAYVPVLHEGYRRFFEKYKNASLYILGPEMIGKFSQLSKEIRQLDPEIIKKSLLSWGVFKSVFIAGEKEIQEIKDAAEEIVMPDEEIMHELAEKYFSGKKVIFDAIFLRWDKHSTTKEKEVSFDRKISADDFDKEMILAADAEG